MAVLIAVGIYTGKHGQGRYQWNVPLANMLKLLKVSSSIDLKTIFSPFHLQDYPQNNRWENFGDS